MARVASAGHVLLRGVLAQGVSLAVAGGICACLLTACGDKKQAAEAASAPETPASAAVDAASGVASEAAAPAPMAIQRSGQADRVAPPDVPPVERDGIRYAQAADGRSLGFKQVGGVLEATEVSTGKRLWSLPVYTREIDPKLEADVQWVFFRSMRFADGGELLIENESGEKYIVDVNKRSITPAPR